MRLDQLQDTRILGAERDPFLHALLGLRVLCERFDALLPCRSAQEEEGVEAPPEPGDEIPELALLGALRVRRLLAGYEASLCATASEPPPTAVTASVDRVQRFPTALLR